jgi:D-threo-aldose 1-dehydrogenase
MDVSGTAVLGDTGLTLTALGLGAAPLGGLFSEVSDADAAATVEAALAAGLRYFDVAPLYGYGLAERRLGCLLSGRPREEYVLSTKVGRLVRPVAEREPGDMFTGAPPGTAVFDYSRDGVLRSVENSLDRLGVDRVDILYIHDPDDHYRAALDEAYPALHELRSQKVVSAIGVGMNQAGMLTRFVRETDLDAVLCAGRYTLLDQSALADLLPACTERGVSVVIGGVYNSGILARPATGARYDYRPAPETLLERARWLGTLCTRHGVPLKAAAIQFPAAHPAVRSILTGARSADELAENVEMFTWPVPDALWQELVDAGALPAGAPIPRGAR